MSVGRKKRGTLRGKSVTLERQYKVKGERSVGKEHFFDKLKKNEIIWGEGKESGLQAKGRTQIFVGRRGRE